MDYQSMTWQELVDECVARGCTIQFAEEYHSREELIDWLSEEFCYMRGV